jgi:hypothetical protein
MILKSDEWYHEFGNAFCKLCNSSHIAIKYLKEGKPVQDIIEELESGIPNMATCNKIVQKVWHDERKAELETNAELAEIQKQPTGNGPISPIQMSVTTSN